MISFRLFTDMHFALKSTGYLDKGRIPIEIVRSFIRYGEITTSPSFGISIMVVDHKSGDVYDMKSFHTYRHRSESHKMVRYIRRLPRGLIVLGVVHSDWTKHSTPELHRVLVRHSLFAI